MVDPEKISWPIQKKSMVDLEKNPWFIRKISMFDPEENAARVDPKKNMVDPEKKCIVDPDFFSVSKFSIFIG